MVYCKKDHHYGSIYAMDWSPDGNFIATGSNDKSIKILGIQNLKFEKVSSFLPNLNL